LKSRNLLFPPLLFLLLVLCCACQVKPGVSSDTSTIPDSSDLFRIREDQGIVLADIVIQEIYPDVCHDEKEGESYILASCKIRKPFFISTRCANFSSLSEKESVFLLWVNAKYVQDQYHADLFRIIEQAESFIMYAEERPAIVGWNGLDDEVIRTFEEYGLDCSVDDSYLTKPPSLYVPSPYMWSLIPIMDGTVDGSAFQKIMNDSHLAEAVYDIEQKDDSRLTNGDTIEDVYEYLERHVERSKK